MTYTALADEATDFAKNELGVDNAITPGFVRSWVVGPKVFLPPPWRVKSLCATFGMSALEFYAGCGYTPPRTKKLFSQTRIVRVSAQRQQLRRAA